MISENGYNGTGIVLDAEYLAQRCGMIDGYEFGHGFPRVCLECGGKLARDSQCVFCCSECEKSFWTDWLSPQKQIAAVSISIGGKFPATSSEWRYVYSDGVSMSQNEINELTALLGFGRG